MTDPVNTVGAELGPVSQGTQLAKYSTLCQKDGVLASQWPTANTGRMAMKASIWLEHRVMTTLSMAMKAWIWLDHRVIATLSG